MKKLMFAVVAMTAGVCLSDIVSANVVGYQEVPAPLGYSMRTPTFKAVSGDYKWSDIKVIGEIGGYGDVTAQIMTSEGAWADTQYYYLNEDGAGVEEGWYKDDVGQVPVTDKDVLTVGQGFFLNSGTVAVSLNVSGEVISGTPEVSAPLGYSMVGNPTPVDQKFSDIKVVGAIGGYGDVTAQVMNGEGAWEDTQYYYLNEDGAGVEEGWYKDDVGQVPVTDEDVIAAGGVIFLNSGTVEVALKFKSVL